MQNLTEPATQHLAVFVLVLVRVAGLVLVAPLLGPLEVPARARIVLALALALLVVPLEIARGTEAPDSLPRFLVASGGEALVGLTLGLGVRLLFSAMLVTGQTISQMSGMQLAEVFSPGAGGSVPIFSQLLYLAATAVFVVIGGHRRVLEALLDTFVWLPAGQGGLSPSALAATTDLLTQSFVLGIRAAAPVAVALLLAALILGMIGRTLPQLNVMALGFGVHALVALTAVGLSLGGACWMFHDQLEPALETALRALGSK